MNCPRNQLLAGARLAAHKHRRIRPRHFQNHLFDTLHLRRRRDDLAVDRVKTIERAIDRFEQRRFVVRLFEVVKRAAPECFLGRLDRAVGSKQDDDDRRVVGQQVLQQLDAVHAGHLQIRQSKIEPAILRKLECGFARSGGGNVVTFLREDQLENFSLCFLVVNYQNILSWHVCSL